MKPAKPSTNATERIAFSIDEIAACLGISRSAVYTELTAGRLKSSKIGRRRVITIAQRDEYLRRIQGGR